MFLYARKVLKKHPRSSLTVWSPRNIAARHGSNTNYIRTKWRMKLWIGSLSWTPWTSVFGAMMASNHGQCDTREKTTRGIGLYVHPFIEPLRYVEIFTRLHTFGNIGQQRNEPFCLCSKQIALTLLLSFQWKDFLSASFCWSNFSIPCSRNNFGIENFRHRWLLVVGIYRRNLIYQ